jgi:prepilin signal peptidase PulO-like enzyme (type II secretory pathway)
MTLTRALLLLVPVLSALLAARPLLAWAARRSAAQPVDVHPDLERALVAAVLARPSLFPQVAALDPDAFATPELRRAWELFHAVCPGMAPGNDVTASTAAAWFAQRGELMPADLTRQVLELDPSLASTAAALVREPARDDAAVQAAGERVRDAAASRSLAGAVPLVLGDGIGSPLVSRTVPAATRRRFLAAAAMLLAGLAAAMVGPAAAGGPAAAVALAAAALTVLAVGSAVWALVDHDTLYIDMRTFWPLTAAAWALAGCAAAARGDLTVLVLAVACTVAVGAVFTAGSALFAAARGQFGMGGGDVMLVAATVGVPVAVTGHWTVAYASVMAALVLAVAWAVARRGRPAGAFAFGPFLCLGWPAAVLLEAARLLPW